ncbi:MAG: TPM domain-containing protein [Mangrovibacterium sp.]
MKKLQYLFALLCLSLIAASSWAQDIPVRPNPPRLVNDMAGVLNANERQSLEAELEQYARSTSTQIVVVTVPSLNDYDVSDYAFRLGETWGVGQKGKDNGIVVLFKPKTAQSKGQVFIATGYGLEAVLPDATANQIVRNEMIPHFKQNDIYGGLAQACAVIKSLAAKEFTPQEYEAKHEGNSSPIAVLFILFIFFVPFILLSRSSKRGYYNAGARRSDLPFWLMMGVMNSGRRSGSWNDFSGGSGFGSSGGGGFGGFGGGSFGGGGAGGSW